MRRAAVLVGACLFVGTLRLSRTFLLRCGHLGAEEIPRGVRKEHLLIDLILFGQGSLDELQVCLVLIEHARRFFTDTWLERNAANFPFRFEYRKLRTNRRFDGRL